MSRGQTLRGMRWLAAARYDMQVLYMRQINM